MVMNMPIKIITLAILLSNYYFISNQNAFADDSSMDISVELDENNIVIDDLKIENDPTINTIAISFSEAALMEEHTDINLVLAHDPEKSMHYRTDDIYHLFIQPDVYQNMRINAHNEYCSAQCPGETDMNSSCWDACTIDFVNIVTGYSQLFNVISNPTDSLCDDIRSNYIGGKINLLRRNANAINGLQSMNDGLTVELESLHDELKEIRSKYHSSKNKHLPRTTLDYVTYINPLKSFPVVFYTMPKEHFLLQEFNDVYEQTHIRQTEIIAEQTEYQAMIDELQNIQEERIRIPNLQIIKEWGLASTQLEKMTWGVLNNSCQNGE
jgi:hypothetical protein